MKQEILDTVQENPGIHFREVQRETGCSSTTLNHHVQRMDLKEKEINGYRRFYPQDIEEELERPLAALNHEVRGLMLYNIRGGIRQKDLVDKLDLSKSTVSSHVKVLREDGIIEEEVEGRSKKIFPSDNALKALNNYASRIIDEASDGFIDMWE